MLVAMIVGYGCSGCAACTIRNDYTTCSGYITHAGRTILDTFVTIIATSILGTDFKINSDGRRDQNDCARWEGYAGCAGADRKSVV